MVERGAEAVGEPGELHELAQRRIGAAEPNAEFDRQGNFRFADLPVGDYTLEVAIRATAFPKGDRIEGVQAKPETDATPVQLIATRDNLQKLKP